MRLCMCYEKYLWWESRGLVIQEKLANSILETSVASQGNFYL